VRLRDGKYECVNCGALVDAPPGEVPYAVVLSTSGRPDYQLIVLHGKELHRCEITPDEEAAR
jgi:hypothetical protein